MDLGKLLTVTVQSLESLATDFLEYEHFLCFGVIVKDGSLHNCSLYIRSSNLYGAFCINEKNLSIPASTLNCWLAMSTIAYIVLKNLLKV